MLFTCAPSEVVAFISETLAFSGRNGLLLEDLWSTVANKLEQNALDPFQKSIIWKWMLHPSREFTSGRFIILRDGKAVSSKSSYDDLVSMYTPTSETDLVILPTEEVQWQFLTHQRYTKRLKLQLGEFPFQLLCEIGRYGKKGIFASELSKATGQDPRSMTPRLRKLEEAGHIVKRSAYNEAASQHTSLCIHINFADSEVESAATDFDDDFESSRNIYKLKQFIMHSLKEAPNELRGFKDLKVELNLHKDRSSGKFFRGIIEALHKRGYAERVLVNTPDQQAPIYCIRYIKDLPKDVDEISDFVDLSRSMKDESLDDVEDSIDLLPCINQVFPLSNQLLRCINLAGAQGSTSMNLIRSLTGRSDFRPLVKVLDAFTTYLITGDGKKLAKLSLDPFTNLSISRAYDFEGKFKFYRYFLHDNLNGEDELANVKASSKDLKQLNKSHFKAIGRVPPGGLLSIRKRKALELKSNIPKRARPSEEKDQPTSNEADSPFNTDRDVSTRESMGVKKESEPIPRVSAGSLKASKRRAELLAIIKDLGGVAYTTANLCRLLDSRLGNYTVTDKKTLARDVSILITDNSISVENIEFMRSGQKISRKLLILNTPGDKPSSEKIKEAKRQCIEDVGNRPSGQSNRRIIDGQVVIRTKIEVGRLTSLSTNANEVKVENENEASLPLEETGGKKEKRKALKKKTVKSKSTTKRISRNLKGNKFDADDENVLFRAVVISKTFHRSIDFSKIAALWDGLDEKSIKQKWSAHRKAIGGQSTVSRGIETFENIVMNGIEQSIISNEELKSINLQIFLDLWGDFDVTTTAVAEKEPLYHLLVDNQNYYCTSELQGHLSDMSEQLEDSSMRQKEVILAKRPFYSTLNNLELASNSKAKTAIRAIIATNEDHFDPRQVSKILERFSESDVSTATTEMVKSKEILFQENENFKFQFSEKFQVALNPKSFGVRFLHDSREFIDSLSELGNASKGLVLSQAIGGSHMAVILSLFAQKRLELLRIDRPYKLNGYESRLIDKNKLLCDLIVRETDPEVFRTKPKTKVPSGKAGSHLWLGADGSINLNLWMKLLAGILAFLVLRPGTHESVLFNRLKPALELDDCKSVIKWLAANGCLQRLKTGSLHVKPTWLVVLG